MKTDRENLMSVQADKFMRSEINRESPSFTAKTPLMNLTASAPTLLTINQLCQLEPALTPGGIRHLLFTKGHNLPGVYRFGRKILFDRTEFMGGIKKGSTAIIGGRKSA
ncbi:MAG: hypothetical protein FH754_12890 [Marinobacter sp.]|nr:hypothetical protein [Marinobacter sp.]